MDLRCRSRRNVLHRFQFHRPTGDRAVDLAPRQGCRYPDALFPVWRYHRFFTDSEEPVDAADITHRRHAIIETVFADLIDGPPAHMPSGSFGANSAWILCAAIAHNLLRAVGVPAGATNALTRGSAPRRRTSISWRRLMRYRKWQLEVRALRGL
jgi:hypothetical protein